MHHVMIYVKGITRDLHKVIAIIFKVIESFMVIGGNVRFWLIHYRATPKQVEYEQYALTAGIPIGQAGLLE